MEFQEIIAPVFTPTNQDGEINYKIILDYAKYLVQCGIKGVLVGGTTGEGMCLSLDERKKLMTAWLEAAKLFQLQTIVQVGGTVLPDVVELAKYAEVNKVAAIMTLPELYFKPNSAEELVDYLELVSKAAPTIPLLYYHFPAMSGVSVNVKQLVEIASTKIPNFKGLKANFDVAVQLQKANVKVFIGNHSLATSSLLGFKLSIATVTNIFPEIVLKILSAMKNKDTDLGRNLQEKLNCYVDDISREGQWVPTMKYSMGIITGLDMGPPRAPLKPLSDVQKENIKRKLLQK